MDSPQWKWVASNHPEFEEDARNLHLGLCADGVNPFAQKRSIMSVWPIVIFNYNIPPWLTSKKFFIMLSLLVPGPDSVTGDNIDVFLAPLIEELSMLWMEGVHCHDAGRWRGETHFVLKAILLWCMHDYPAYGMMAGVTNKGYRGCPKCGVSTCGRYSHSLRKIVYGECHRRWLPPNHPWRTDVTIFPNVELQAPPIDMAADDHVRWAYLREEYIQHGGVLDGEADPVSCSGVKRLPSLFSLPYWRVMYSILGPHFELLNKDV